MLKRIIALSLVGVLFAAFPGKGTAGFVAINSPTAAYTSSTTLIPITQVDGTNLNSISDGSLTVSFSNTLQARTVPATWLTWGSPPDTETNTPRALYNSVNTLTLTLSQSVVTFGVEAESASFSTLGYTADFYNGATLVGSVSRNITGNAGARLLAASATAGDVFTRVVITTDSGFAIAQIRYAAAPTNAVPAPSGLILAALGAPFAFGVGRIRRAIGV